MPNKFEREHGYDVMRLEKNTRKKILQKHADWQVSDDWWDCVYEDAKRMGALMGIEVDGIQFSGFCSQGDGASFTGQYACKPDAVEAVAAECGGTDETLITIATELTQLQITWKLQHGFTWECDIARSAGIHVHSSMMTTGWSDDEEAYERVGFGICSIMDKQVERLMRRFADWIYHQLEQEHEYLTSEEAVVEMIRSSGLRFTSSGDTFAL